MSETDDQLARRLLGSVLDGDLKWTPDMRLRIATVSQAYVSLAILDELCRLNEDRSQWYREVLEVLTQAKEPDGSLRSRQPEAATSCPVCDRPSPNGECQKGTPLTRDQWVDHHSNLYYEACAFSGPDNSELYANGLMEKWFGPCPEES